MPKHTSNGKREVVVCIFSLIVGVGLGFFIAENGIVNTNALFAEKQKPSSTRTFQSKRVPFAFTYPTDFKIAILPNWAVYQFDNRVEAINVGTSEATPNAGGSKTGYIMVDKVAVDSRPLEEKLKQEYEQETATLKLGMGDNKGAFTRELPTYTKVKVGNAEGIKATFGSGAEPGNFAPSTETYYVERESLRYTIGITTSDQLEKAKIEKLLSTFDFQY